MKVLLVPLLFLFAGCQAHMPSVRHLSSGPAGEGALVYALPKTRIEVRLKAAYIEVDLKKAPCAFAFDLQAKTGRLSPEERALRDALDRSGLKKPTQPASLAISAAVWTLATQPDAKQIYELELPESRDFPAQDKLSVELEQGWSLSQSTFEAEDETVAAAGRVTNFVAGIVGSVFGLGGAPSLESTAPPKPVRYCTALLEQREETGRALTALYADLRVDQAVAEWSEARLKAQMKTRAAAFTGAVSKVGEVRCSISPVWKDGAAASGAADVALDPAPRLPSIDLVTVAKEGTWWVHPTCRIPGGFPASAGKPNTGVRFGLELELGTDLAGPLPTTVDEAKKHLTPGGAEGSLSYVYRRPRPATVWISKGQREVPFTPPARAWLPQLGRVAALPRLKGRKVAGTVRLDPKTGALTAFQVSTETVDPSTSLESVGTLVQAVAKETASKSELEQAKERKELLEALVAIEAAEAKLGK
ncbi:MAG: hypothetical protein AAFZ18_15070 [Myxococcota bacterium]